MKTAAPTNMQRVCVCACVHVFVANIIFMYTALERIQNEYQRNVFRFYFHFIYCENDPKSSEEMRFILLLWTSFEKNLQ